MTTTCPDCGADGGAGARFCGQCGAALAVAVAGADVDELPGIATKPAATPATKKPATKKPATKKPATKKPATKKPATKKPATRPVGEGDEADDDDGLEEQSGHRSPNPRWGHLDRGVAGFVPDAPLADMGTRLAARVIDGAIFLAVLLPLAFLVSIASAYTTPHFDLATGEIVGSGNDSLRLVVALVFAAFVLGYEPFLVATRGATVGKRVMKIRVVLAQDGDLPGWGPAVVRSTVPLLGILACCVGIIAVYMSPLFDHTGRFQGWHDRAAGTFVVRD